ncbi:LysR family transcriptional regulator substrate-binding protein [Comamonas sp. JC664]
MRAQVSWMIATFDQAWRRCSSGCSTRAALSASTASIGIAVDCAVHGPVPAAHPEVHFVLDDMHSDTLIESITQGDADIAVGLHFDMPAHIDSRLITSDEIVVVVSPRHRWPSRPSCTGTISKTSRWRCCGGAIYDMITTVLREQGVHVNVPHNLSSIESLYALVHSDLKVG